MKKFNLPESAGLSERGKVYDSATNEVIDLFENVRVWHYTQDSMPPDDSTILVTTLSGEVLFARYFEKDMDFIVAVRTSKGFRAERYDPVQIMAWMELPGAYIPGKRGGEKMKETIRAIVKEPGKEAQEERIGNDLKSLQKRVGGYIETVSVQDDLVIICNEEGKLLDLPYNCTLLGEPFAGTILFVGIDGENFADCPISLDFFRGILSE